MGALEIHRFLFTAGLRGSAGVGKEVDMAQDVVIAHPLSGCMNDVDEMGSTLIEPVVGCDPVKSRPCWIEARQSSDPSTHAVAKRGSPVSPQADPD